MDKYITEDEIRKAAMTFDGCCPFIDHNTECSSMSVINCNKCKIIKNEGDIGSTGNEYNNKFI